MGGNYVSVGGHQVGKTAKNGLGNGTGVASGSTGSGSAVSLIRAVASLGTSSSSNHVAGYSSGGYVDSLNTTEYPGSTHSHFFSVGTTAQSISGDNETRPVNRGVRYIIKV